MSRVKLRSVTDICGDCGALDPTWASVNRGILLCEECCSVHRSLGRHISRVKSLRKGNWTASQLAMVHTLNNNGANSIWEHSLLDPTHAKSGRKKPQPKDPVHPTKADFIRAKHQMLAFVYRPDREEGTQSEDADLSRQLHSSVRTANLETSLRMLAQGADANFFHPEKGTCPLHVAAKEGQAGQVELLLVYGADPGATDSLGHTPANLAKMAGHADLAARLTEGTYELTDRLAHFLCGRVPDHRANQHFIVPEMADSLDPPELAKAARRKLQALPNHLFEELAMDVYDEVDRRETESIWASLQPWTAPPLDRSCVPFLPVNPELSATRNQGRQKLARLNPREFAVLIIDILSDAKRRQAGTVSMIILPREQGDKKSVNRGVASLHANVPGGRPGRPCRSEVSDDEPLYDSVASDEDYVTAASLDTLSALSAVPSLAQSSSDEKEASPQPASGAQPTNTPKEDPKHELSKPSQLQSSAVNGGTSSSMEELLKKQLELSEARLDSMSQEIKALQATVSQLVQEKGSDVTSTSPLQSQVHLLIAENNQLRNIIAQAGLTPSASRPSLPNGDVGSHSRSATPPGPASLLGSRSPRASSHQRPVSMYEPRAHSQQGHASAQPSMATITGSYSNLSCLDSESWRGADDLRGLTPSPPLPDASEVRARTDVVTKCIQDLWAAMVDNRRELFLPCAVRIRTAVADLSLIFPQAVSDELIKGALQQLNSHTCRLQAECASLLSPGMSPSLGPEGPLDPAHTQLVQKVRACAYDIAKATKVLVTRFQV